MLVIASAACRRSFSTEEVPVVSPWRLGEGGAREYRRGRRGLKDGFDGTEEADVARALYLRIPAATIALSLTLG